MDKSSGSEGPRKSSKARSRSRSNSETKVKSEQSDEDPPPPITDGFLTVIVKQWQQEQQQQQHSPTSPDSTYHSPDEKEEVRSPSFEPDYTDSRHEIEPEDIHEREGQTSQPRGVSVMFIKPWGKLSWHVFYNGPYDNARIRHVELRTQDEYDRNIPATLWHTMQKGTSYELSDIHHMGEGIAWFVGDLHKGQGEERQRVHFTVSDGSGKPIENCIPDLVRESRAKEEIEI